MGTKPPLAHVGSASNEDKSSCGDYAARVVISAATMHSKPRESPYSLSNARSSGSRDE